MDKALNNDTEGFYEQMEILIKYIEEGDYLSDYATPASN